MTDPEELVELGRGVDDSRIAFAQACEAAAERILSRIKCTRVTFWVVAGEPGRFVLKRIATDLTKTSSLEIEEVRIDSTVFKERFCVSNDTLAAPSFANVVASFLAPPSARALMAACIGANGEAWGVISCTQDAPRLWQPAEMAMLKRFAAQESVLWSRQRMQEGSRIGAPNGMDRPERLAQNA